MGQLRVSFFLLLFLGGLFGLPSPSSARPYLNEVSLDVPVDGGGFLTLARHWRLNEFFQAGFEIGGGLIKREFDLTLSSGEEVEAETAALVLPYAGPRLTFFYHVIGISLGYGVFYAKTDFETSGGGLPDLSGDVSGWGTGFHAPFLVFDFYDRKRDMIFGFGLGGFSGASYPDLVATAPGVRLTTDENPLEGITFHIRTLWSGSRRQKTQEEF